MKLSNRLRNLSAWFVTGALAAGCVGHIDGEAPTAGPASTGPNSGSGTSPHGGAPSPGTGSQAGAAAGSTPTSPAGAGSAGAGSGGAGSAAGGNAAAGTASSGAGAGSAPAGPRDPGRVTARQLNRVEYDNTVRDLLGTTLQPGTSFLNDAPEFAFDNNADMLSVSPVQAGMYQKAAEALAAEAIAAKRPSALVTCDLAAAGDTCLRTIVTNFGAKAYRRPLAADQVAGYLQLATAARAAGATADEALRTIVEAMLISPHFLYRVELDPTPTSLTPHAVDPYELASRLSYLVYRSMPDQALFDAAAAGKLSAPADVQGQLTRMLADSKGATFAKDFSTQWLGARSLETADFDVAVFPGFSPALATSMKAELTGFFDEFVRENRPVAQLLTADFSYIDGNLAKHYGLPAVGAGGVQRTPVTSSQRGGLMLMAGTLAVTSYPTRTSLVKRGAWVLGQLLCSEPPPPPFDVPGFPEGVTSGTQRQILEMHRKEPSCAGCHVIMDNLGIALENYDAIGAWRTTDKSGAVIDANGVLPNGGAAFNGGREMAAVVAADPRFPACLASKMLSYALGRSLSASDEPYIADIAAVGQSGQPGVRDILARVVASDTFNMRRGEAPGGQP